MINHEKNNNKQPSKTSIPKKINTNTVQDDEDDEEYIQSSDSSSKVKYLPPSVLKDIEQKNGARKLAGLPPIITRIRRCLTCGTMFQSAGNRTCGCTSRTAGTIAGREII